MLLIQNEERWHYLEHGWKWYVSVGIEAELIPAARLREIEPYLEPAGLWAVFIRKRKARLTRSSSSGDT